MALLGKMTALLVGVAGMVMPLCPADARPVPPPACYEGFATGNPIDGFVLAELKKSHIAPSAKCADEVFVRRVYLDVDGTLPTSDVVRNFLSNRDPDKRRRLIDSLLKRDEFADYWGLKWGDLLRVKSEFPCNLWPNAVQAYDRWIRDCFRTNMPYDRFAHELLTANGSNFRAPPANFYRAFQERTPGAIAETVALVFMGVRLHDAGWPEARIQGFSAFFAKVGYKSTDEWKEEIVFFKPDANTNFTARPAFPDGAPLTLRPDQDPRVALADWLTAPGNPWFARAIVNRIWYWLLGRGLVHEPDDMKPANPPWSPALLAFLEKELVDHHYDLKHIYRLILNSNTYQLDSRPNEWNAADETGFSRYRLRRLDAEVLLDAINRITWGGEKYVSPIPEPFTVLPWDQRAIKLADGSIESPFLELFGRPPRNTSFESERSTAPSVFQAQHLLNSSHIQKKIENSQAIRQLAGGPPAAGAPGRKGAPAQAAGAASPKPVEELYLRILSRFPSAEEKQAAETYLASSKRKPAESVGDLAWALINTKEFSVRH
jgi:hypothetical protein